MQKEQQGGGVRAGAVGAEAGITTRSTSNTSFVAIKTLSSAASLEGGVSVCGSDENPSLSCLANVGRLSLV